MSVAVNASIKEALDELIFNGNKQITAQEHKKKIAEIISHHVKFEHWTVYRQLNSVSLEDLIEMLTEGYYVEDTPLDVQLKRYSTHLKTVSEYSSKPYHLLDSNEKAEYEYARGFVNAVNGMHDARADLSKVELPQL